MFEKASVHIDYIQWRDTVNITVYSSAVEPIYEQIVRQIKKLIINEELQPEDMLPSIRNLARDLKISVITTKRAYEELEKEGFIESVLGKGTFVSARNKEFIREKRVKILEDKMNDVIEEGRHLNIGLQGLKIMIEVLYREQ